MSGFKFRLDQRVKLALSSEAGIVIARAEYLNGPNQYRVRYLTADQRQVEEWWEEAAIVAE